MRHAQNVQFRIAFRRCVLIGLSVRGAGRSGMSELCHFGVVDGWTEVAWIPPAQSGTAKADLDAALDAFLSQRGLSLAELAENDIRVDLVYLGSDAGGCGRRLMIRTTAVPPGR